MNDRDSAFDNIMRFMDDDESDDILNPLDHFSEEQRENPIFSFEMKSTYLYGCSFLCLIRIRGKRIGGSSTLQNIPPTQHPK